MTTTYTLFNYWRSSASWRVRTALNLKGIAYEYVAVHIGEGKQFEGSYRERNPMQQVPTLAVSDARGTHFLAQSIAILEFLEEMHPEPALLPKDAFLRARVRELAEAVNAGIQPHQNLKPMGLLEKAQPGIGKAHAVHHNEVGLEALERRVQETKGRFCVGDSPTFADICLVPQLYSARRFGVTDVAERFPTLVGIEANCLALEAFSKARPDAQPDAVAV
jgi:maleylpyruvate isomerase